MSLVSWLMDHRDKLTLAKELAQFAKVNASLKNRVFNLEHELFWMLAADLSWIDSKLRPPEAGLVIKRWKSGAIWAGRIDGSPKSQSCDEWMFIEK